jgi:phosphate-selective porin OprO/OprP
MKKTILILMCAGLPMLSYAQSDNDSVRYNQYGIKVNRTPLTAEARNGILVFESKDQSYKYWFDARVDADGATFWGQDKDFDKIGNGAAIRRARIAIKAQISPDWYGEVDVDLANGSLELKDAYVAYQGIENLELQAGNFKENFSIARNTSSRYQQFIERPLAAQALAPSRHIGINAKYRKNWLWASGGVFFQSIEGQETRTYVEDNNKDFGRDEGYSYTGKIVFQPFYNSDDMALHIGGALSYRTPKTEVDPSEYGGTRISTRNSTSINRKKYLDTDVIPNVHHDLLYTFELAGLYKGLRFEAVYMQNDTHIRNDAPATVDQSTKHFSGRYVQAGYLLFGGQQKYNYGDAKFTQVTRGRSWGDLEIALRYDQLNLNSKNIFGGAAEAYTVGLNYYANNNVKIMLDYQYNNNDRYANGKGKLFVGHDTAGKPTKDPTKVADAKGKAGVDYSMLAIRFEIAF